MTSCVAADMIHSTAEFIGNIASFAMVMLIARICGFRIVFDVLQRQSDRTNNAAGTRRA